MPQMKRNLNLEEVDADAFLGIKFLLHQTILQKIIFFGGTFAGISILITGTLLGLSYAVTFPLVFVLLACSVLFGANYNKDYSVYEYLKMMLLKPEITLISKPTEDIEVFKLSAERLRKDEEEKLARQKAASKEEQRRMLFMVIGLMSAAVVFIVVVVALTFVKKNEKPKEMPVIHHTISYEITSHEGFYC